jgi:hypothetical protein
MALSCLSVILQGKSHSVRDTKPPEPEESEFQDEANEGDSSEKKRQKVKVTIEIMDRRIGRGNASKVMRLSTGA